MNSSATGQIITIFNVKLTSLNFFCKMIAARIVERSAAADSFLHISNRRLYSVFGVTFPRYCSIDVNGCADYTVISNVRTDDGRWG